MRYVLSVRLPLRAGNEYSTTHRLSAISPNDSSSARLGALYIINEIPPLDDLLVWRFLAHGNGTPTKTFLSRGKRLHLVVCLEAQRPSGQNMCSRTRYLDELRW
jgi:hypothetical protein